MLSNREIIQAALAVIGNAETMSDKVAAVARSIESLSEFDARMRGAADRVTTRQILRHLRQTGRA